MPDVYEDDLPSVVPMNRDYDQGRIDGEYNPLPDCTPGVTTLPNGDDDDELVSGHVVLPWSSNALWTMIIPPELRVWRWDASLQTWWLVESGESYSVSVSGKEFNLKVEGLAPSGVPPYLTVSCQKTDAEGSPLGLPVTDRVLVEVVSIDLEVAEISELDEETQPAFVPLNDDYDENNTHGISGDPVTDNGRLHDQLVSVPPRIVADDDDLVCATLTIDGPNGQTGRYWIEVLNEPSWLEYPDWPGYNQYIRVWLADGTPVPRSRETALPITLGGDPIELRVEGLAPYHDYYFQHLGLKAHFIPDGDYAEAGILPEVVDEVMADVIPIGIDLLVDTNRDNSVTDDDQEGEDNWTRERGAIILLNSDIDNTTTNAPDNWAGGVYTYWNDLSQTYEYNPDVPPNNEVDGNGDIDDIGPLVLRKLNISTLPDDLVITLFISKPATEKGWFTQYSAEERVRIFLPDNGSCVAEGDKGIIGPGLGTTFTFVKSPQGDHEGYYSIFSGSGDIRFGIEGIIPGAMVDITATISLNGKALRTDTVRVKVTPFILLNNTGTVTDEGGTVFVSEEVSHGGLDNTALRNALNVAYWGNLRSGPEQDVWLQDGCEIGYVQAPYGQMPMVLELPRSQRNGVQMPSFIEHEIVRKNVGIYILDGTGTTQDCGGNIECLPDPSGNSPGFFFHGSGMSSFLTDFFAAQDVNPSLSVNTSWLCVQHVDEVVSLASDGSHIAVADPEMAIGLLRWAEQIDPDAPMCQNMNNCGPDGNTVSDVLATHEAYNLTTVMAAGNLPSIVNVVADATQSTRNTWLVTPGENPNTGNAVLIKAKAFTAFLSGYRSFEIRFISATDYEVWYHDDPQSPWIKDNSHVGQIGRDDVFAEAKAFILGSWWGGAQAAVGDAFRFCADPNVDIVEVPVLFWDVGGATAFTSDCVNALVDGIQIFTPETYGPVVNYSGVGAADILHDYVNAAFSLCN